MRSTANDQQHELQRAFRKIDKFIIKMKGTSTKLRQLETLARKEAIVKDAPDNRVRRRSQKLKDIAHQAKCVNNSLEKRAEDRKEYERKRLYELSRAPSEAVRMWKKATMERDKR